jgi:alpha-L-fucosidase
LPALPNKVLEAKALLGGDVKCDMVDNQMIVSVPADRRDPIATVIVLTVEGSAVDIPPIGIASNASGSLAAMRPAKASNVFAGNISAYGPTMALDGDPDTRWATDAGVRSASLDVDLGESQTIGRIRIIEPAQYQRVRKFQIKVRDGGDWKLCHEGTTIGPKCEITLEPIAASRIMLQILDASDGPTLTEFQVFPPARK